MHRIAPIFAVHDLDVALEHYRRLGFVVRRYPPGGYGFASREGVEIHLSVVPGDELAAQWRTAGIAVHGPQDTEWGQHEGAMVDPDGNIIRFGSPIPEHDHSHRA